METNDPICFDMASLGEVLALPNTGFQTLAAEGTEFMAMDIDNDWNKGFQVTVQA